MSVLIQNYRGYEIVFDPESERFSFSTDEASWYDKQSFAACKKKIDEFLKDNEKFEPFYVRKHGVSPERRKIVGIRKDGRFATEEPDGSKGQISEYNEKDWILDNPEYDAQFAAVALLQIAVENAEAKVFAALQAITSTTLKEYKNSLTTRR